MNDLVGNKHCHTIVKLNFQVDPQINFVWPGAPTANAAEDYFSVRWYGVIVPKATGTHVIRVEADYAVAVKLGAKWIINEWDSTVAVSERAQQFLRESQPVDIEVW
jgi:hypothetical protein